MMSHYGNEHANSPPADMQHDATHDKVAGSLCAGDATWTSDTTT